MELSVYNKEGKETGNKVSLSDAVFGIEPNDHAIYLDVKQYHANGRQGTHKSKERGEIKGSTRKIKRQKGTGGARAGSLKNPLFRGGGRVFGPRPRNYSFKLNVKLKRLARKSALSYKASASAIKVVEDFQLDSPKTKSIVAILNNLDINARKSLLVLNGVDKNVYLSARNVPGVKVVTASELNTYDIVNSNQILFWEGSVSQVEETLN